MSTFSWRVLRLPLLITLLWGLLLFTLFRWTAQREDEYTTGLARIQTATLFSSIVDTRDWNANNGGVWVREHPGCPANPWLPEEERTLRAEGGTTLVKVNPAYMTRQIAESFTSTLASFRISSLSPKRPENRADQWETGALLSFEKDRHELFDLVSDKEGMRYRYMAALPAKESCIQCHQDKKVGDVLGGISVSISAEPLFAAATERKRTTGLAFGIIGIIGMVGIGGATFQINRKKELAEAANRTKSAFLANMTHDMRTPLTGILGMTELLERETQDSRHRYLLANLRKATDSLLTVVDGIMRYSLLEADRQPTCCAPFSLRAELGACIAVLRPACASRDIRLSLVTDDTVPDRLVGDGFRLRQALGNLLGNAVKYNKVGGEIFLTSREIALTEDTVTFEFTVRDTGKGMSEAFQQRAFEPFAQEEASARSSYVGTGLGLAIVKELVEKMGGEITLQSEKNVGSTFTVRLTFKQDKDAQRADDDAHGGAVSIRGTKVLLVEDNDLNMEIAEFMLQNEGVVVTKAADGRQAVDAFAASKPGDIDVILMDVMMPVMDGLEAARRIRSLNRPDAKTIPIFAMTANAFADDAERSRQAGMNEHLTKPLDAQVLLKTIGKYRKQGK